MENWNEIRTAAHVARHGTISAAADALGVHRATVIRHVDVLEAALGQKLFQRHGRGYTPTEVGLDLLRVADATDEQFSELVRRSKSHSSELEGDFVITSLGVVGPLLSPAISAFQQTYPKIQVRFLSNDDVMKLEYGEAHIAFRAGKKPTEPDNVVKPFISFQNGLYASKAYAERKGMPDHIDDFEEHIFVGSSQDIPRAPFLVWLHKHVPSHCFGFLSNDFKMMEQAVAQGLGIGFVNQITAATTPDLLEVLPVLPEWKSTIWQVTHVDLHRSAKVQAFLSILAKFLPELKREIVSR